MINDFFFKPASNRPLAYLRAGIAAVLLVQAWLLSDRIFDLYGSTGILQGSIGDALGFTPLPDMGTVTRLLARIGISEAATITSITSLYVASLLGLLLGQHARFFAFGAWLTHLVLASGQVTSYGVETFAHVFLFYLIWAPSGWREESSASARFWLRIMQLQLCLAYFFGGFDKALGEQWWNGDAIWRALMLPLYSKRDMSFLAHVPWLTKLACWGTLVAETLYPIMVWPRATRRIWVALIVSLHVGIGIFLGLGIFSAFMCVLSLAIFGMDAAPKTKEETVDVREARSLGFV